MRARHAAVEQRRVQAEKEQQKRTEREKQQRKQLKEEKKQTDEHKIHRPSRRKRGNISQTNIDPGLHCSSHHCMSVQALSKLWSCGVTQIGRFCQGAKYERPPGQRSEIRNQRFEVPEPGSQPKE